MGLASLSLLQLLLIVAINDLTYVNATEFVTLTDEDFKNAENVDIHEAHDDSKMYNNDRVEGDLVLPLQEIGSGGASRNGIRGEWKRWDKNVIPYVLGNNFTTKERAIIARAMAGIMMQTCIVFKPRVHEPLYVKIFNGDGCWSNLGMTGKGEQQEVHLGPGCNYVGTVTHELMHTIGFVHEQSRTDRDNYINIIWENIENGTEDQFNKYGKHMINDYGEKYDYNSIMQYSKYAFSKNGLPTMTPKKWGVRLGGNDELSASDARRINAMYKCRVVNVNNLTPMPEPTTKKPCYDELMGCARYKRDGLCPYIIRCDFTCNRCK